MKKACIKMIRLYQKYISPWKRYGHCKYYPTCSNYAIEAYQKYGFFKGTALTVYKTSNRKIWFLKRNIFRNN